jgi:hypothetical protein
MPESGRPKYNFNVFNNNHFAEIVISGFMAFWKWDELWAMV